MLSERLHQLIGSAGIHGLTDIAEEAARLLKVARTGKLDAQPQALDRLEDLVHEANRGLTCPRSRPEDQTDPV